MMTALHEYVMVATLLFWVGFAGVIVRRNLLIIFLSIQMMFGAAMLMFVAFNCSHQAEERVVNQVSQDSGLVILFCIVAAVEMMLGLVILSRLQRDRNSISTDSL